jgi:hypothetical protein
MFGVEAHIGIGISMKDLGEREPAVSPTILGTEIKAETGWRRRRRRDSARAS